MIPEPLCFAFDIEKLTDIQVKFSIKTLTQASALRIISVEKLHHKYIKFSLEGAMDIKRDIYLNRLISFMWDGQVKVITGIRRCGKSYLLRNIFKRWLLEQGVAEDHILSYELDLAKDIQYRNPLELAKAVRERVEGKPDRRYLFVDEIQMSDEIPNPYNPEGKKITFYDALNELLHDEHLRSVYREVSAYIRERKLR